MERFICLLSFKIRFPRPTGITRFVMQSKAFSNHNLNSTIGFMFRNPQGLLKHNRLMKFMPLPFGIRQSSLTVVHFPTRTSLAIKVAVFNPVHELFVLPGLHGLFLFSVGLTFVRDEWTAFTGS